MKVMKVMKVIIIKLEINFLSNILKKIDLENHNLIYKLNYI